MNWIDCRGFLAGCTARARLDYRVRFTVSKFGIILVRWHYQPRRISLYNIYCTTFGVRHVLSPSPSLRTWNGEVGGVEKE